MEEQQERMIIKMALNEISPGAFNTWLNVQPLIDRPAILRTLTNYIQSQFNLDEEMKSQVSLVTDAIDTFEDAVLTKKLNSQLQAIETNSTKTNDSGVIEEMKIVRETIIYLFENKELSSEKIKELAKKAIANEVKINAFFPENWKLLRKLL